MLYQRIHASHGVNLRSKKKPSSFHSFFFNKHDSEFFLAYILVFLGNNRYFFLCKLYTLRKTETNAKENRKNLRVFWGKNAVVFYLLITTNFAPTYFPAKEIAMIPAPGFFLKVGLRNKIFVSLGTFDAFFRSVFYSLTDLCVPEGRDFSTNGLEIRSIFNCIFIYFFGQFAYFFLFFKHFRASPAFYF